VSAPERGAAALATAVRAPRRRTIRGLDAARKLVGTELGVTPWHPILQEDVNRFADVTKDLQWIHVDVERAARASMGGTVAHGLYTLALGPMFMDRLVEWRGFGMILNYGYDRVRFPAPLPVGASVRMRMTLESVDDAPGGGQVALGQVFERQGAERPVCAARFLLRLVEASS
jgi:acyl dehydratase